MTSLAERPSRERGLSVRITLALSYAGFLVVAGIALFAVGFLVLRFVPDGNLQAISGDFAPSRDDLIEVFVRYAWWALAGLAVFGLVGGWMLAGQMLRPVTRIAAVAERARDGALEQRIELPGPRNELTDLADVLDAMLDRLQHTVDEERRFAANASHELRTPHAIIRTLVEVAQADPDGRDTDTVLQRIGDTNDRAIQSTEALLALSRVHRQALPFRPVDLTALLETAIAEVRPDAASIRIDADLRPVTAMGDAALLTQLIANLLQNAVVHNVAHSGWIRVSTGRTTDGWVELVVANSGELIEPALAATLTEPFVRGAGRARGAGGHTGAGLGLAIVASIVRAHGGTLAVTPLSTGGLSVGVRLASAGLPAA